VDYLNFTYREDTAWVVRSEQENWLKEMKQQENENKCVYSKKEYIV